MLIAMFCAGLATFAQLYSPQAVLPSIARDLGVEAASAALMVSAGTLGLALFALPWTYLADRWGKVRAMEIAVVAATVLGLVITRREKKLAAKKAAYARRQRRRARLARQDATARRLVSTTTADAGHIAA